MSYFAKELSQEQRLAIESLIGRNITEKEAIAIRTFEPATISPEQRSEIIAELEAYFAERSRHHDSSSRQRLF